VSSKKSEILFFVLLIFAFSGTVLSSPVHIESGKFTPEESEAEPLAFNSLSANNDFEGYGILQFREPVSSEKRAGIEDDVEGLEFIDYIPENAWIVDYTGPRNEIVSNKNIRYFGPYRPSQRVSKSVNMKASGDLNVSVELFENNSDSLEKFDVKNIGGEKRRVVEVNSTELKQVSRIENVKFIETVSPEKTVLNDDTRQIIGADTVQASPYDLTGKGITAAMWDGGDAGNHSDLNYSLDWKGSKKIQGDGASIDEHATHVAGTMLGGGKINNDYRGVAPDARVITHDFPSSNVDLFSDTDTAINSYDAVVSQNSWGQQPSSCDGKDFYGNYNNLAGDYDSISSGETADVNGKIPIVFASGNERSRCTGEYNTSLPPSTAKNTITVGSIDMNKDLAYYSSMGPTDDGRIKPTLVSHGGDVFSTGDVRSTIPGNSYRNKQGTSMAAPGVSGAIILLNEKFKDVYSRDPDPATVKATLIHTAEDLGNRGPDYKTGWGLINITEAINYVNISDEENLLWTGDVDLGETDSYEIEASGENDLKFTLVWMDKSASSTASETLVNDLDLVVEKDGERYYPWSMSWENRTEPALQDKPDRTNPQEQVVIEDPKPGKYTLEVEGYSVPEGPQSYSLITTDSDNPADITIENPENSTYTDTPDLNVSSNQELKSVDYSIDGGSNISLTEENNSYFYDIEPSISEGRHRLTFWAKNKIDLISSNEVSFTLDSTPPDIDIDSPSNNTVISGDFNLNISFNDSLTGVSSSNITLENDSTVETFSGNTSIDRSDYSDGDYTLKFRASDNAGNTVEKIIELSFDNTAPQLSGFNPSNNSEVKTPVDINASWADSNNLARNKLVIRENGKVLEKQLNYTLNGSEIDDGNYSVNLIAEDSLGNLANETLEVEIISSPNAKIKSPKNITYSEIPEFNITTEKEIAEASVELNGTNRSLTNFNSTYAYNDTIELNTGLYNALFHVEDVEGLTETVSFGFTVDKESPTLDYTNLETDDNVSEMFDIEASFSDLSDISQKTFQVKSISGPLNGTVNSSKLEDGDTSVYLNATDEVGNTVSEKINITVDNEKPSTSISKPVDEFFGDVLDIEYSVDDNVSGVESSEAFLVNESGIMVSFSGNTNYDSSNLEDGNYTLEVNVTDYAGNNVSVEKSLVKDTTDPDVDILLEEGNVTVPFDAEASWKDSSGIDYSHFRLWNGSGTLNLTELNTTISRRDLNGSYNTSFEVKDNAGNLFNETLELNISNTKLKILAPSNEFYRQTPVFNASYPAEIDDAYVDISGQNYTLNKNGDYLTAEPELENGSYQASFNIESYGERLVEHKSFTVDSENPSINSITPIENYNTSSDFDIKLEASDDFSSIEKSTYTIEGFKKNLNDTVDVSKFTDRKYSIEYNVSDSAGNYKITNRNITIDRQDPVLTDSEPVNNSNLSSGFSISSSWDDLTGLKDTKTLLYNETFSSDNSSFDTEDLSDGKYNLSLWAKDFADNSINSTQYVTLDTSVPSISSVAPSNDEVISNESIIEAFVQDGTSGVKDKNLSIYNSSGLIKSFKSNSTWDSNELNDGNYTATFSARDFSGNTEIQTTEFTIDNEKPDIELNLSDLEQLKNGWRGSGNASSTCEDSGTGVQWFNGSEIEINKSRNLSIECIDKTGKKSILEKNLSVDNYKPEIENITPSNRSDLEQEFDIEASVVENESGLDSDLSDFSVTGGTLSTSLDNDSIKATVSEASDTVEVKLNLSDRAGRNSSYTLEYSAPEEENNDDDDDSSGGGGGGGGGGFSLSPDDEEENQTSNNTQEDNRIQTNNITSEKKENKNVSSNNSVKVNLEEKTEINVEDKKTSISSVEASGSGEASFNVVKVEESEGPEGSEVYETVDMDFEGENVSDTNVSFKVRNAWIEERSIEKHEVALYRKNSSNWDRLETRPKETGLNTTTYTARVPDFSRFSIAASRSSSNVGTEKASLQETQQTQEDRSQKEESEEKSQSSGFDISIIDMLIIFLFILSGTVGSVIGYKYYRKKKMKQSMEELRDMVGFDRELILLINEAETQLESGDYVKASEKMEELTEKISEKKK